MSIALLAVASLGIGLALRLLRRLPRLVFVGSLVGAALLSAILFTAPDSALDLFGRALVLDAGTRSFLWFAIAIAAALALFGPLTFEPAADSPSAIIANSQGAFFYWSLAPIIFAIAMDSFPLAVFFWGIGLIILLLMATPRREGRVGGAAQFLLLTVVAVASLFLSNRSFDLFPLTPENLDLASNTVIFLSLGLGLLLAVTPLHIWLGPLSDELPSLGVAFLFGVAQPVGLWLLYRRMSDALWLTEKSPLLTVLLVGGALTVPVGALLALSERRDGRFIAYLSLVALGHALIGLGLGTRVGLASAFVVVLSRAVGVTLVAGGLSYVRHHAERQWQWVGGIAIFAGGATLAGIPPLLGFAARWSVYRDLAALSLSLVALLLASNALVILATLRMVLPLFTERGEVVQTGEVKILPYFCAAVVAILLVVAFAVGLFPQVLGDPLVAALGTASYLK